ncbi:MAG: hypothetical protein KVP17_004206 [Porospora cf. gigantea B]|uniref:uncharacterized protein n=1 Tax=Porospora cf. gigantea B TaxID=2853592 RepID=UPI003571F75F|nr:MAG: hypothetical protein KVP17_004206 [Porospora cf. gigantea B]
MSLLTMTPEHLRCHLLGLYKQEINTMSDSCAEKVVDVFADWVHQLDAKIQLEVDALEIEALHVSLRREFNRLAFALQGRCEAVACQVAAIRETEEEQYGKVRANILKDVLEGNYEAATKLKGFLKGRHAWHDELLPPLCKEDVWDMLAEYDDVSVEKAREAYEHNTTDFMMTHVYPDMVRTLLAGRVRIEPIA